MFHWFLGVFTVATRKFKITYMPHTLSFSCPAVVEVALKVESWCLSLDIYIYLKFGERPESLGRVVGMFAPETALSGGQMTKWLFGRSHLQVSVWAAPFCHSPLSSRSPLSGSFPHSSSSNSVMLPLPCSPLILPQFIFIATQLPEVVSLAF